MKNTHGGLTTRFFFDGLISFQIREPPGHAILDRAVLVFSEPDRVAKGVRGRQYYPPIDILNLRMIPRRQAREGGQPIAHVVSAKHSLFKIGRKGCQLEASELHNFCKRYINLTLRAVSLGNSLSGSSPELNTNCNTQPKPH